MNEEPDVSELNDAIGVVQTDNRASLPRSTHNGGGSQPRPDCDEEITTAAGCRSKAAMLRAAAKLLSDATYRDRALRIADRWTAMAVEYDAMEGRPSDR
jgi:hypothetical protein